MAKAAQVAQIITLRGKLEKRIFSALKRQQRGVLLGQYLLDLQKERSAQGLDVDNKTYKRYAEEYEEAKKAFITSVTPKTKKKTKNKSILRQRSDAINIYKARKVYDYMRLTGNLYNDMKFTVVGVSGGILTKQIIITIRLFIAKNSEEKAEGLIKRGYRFFGFKSFSRREQQEIANIITKGI